VTFTDSYVKNTDKKMYNSIHSINKDMTMKPLSLPFLTFRDAAQPGLSAPGESRIWYNSNISRLMISRDGSEYQIVAITQDSANLDIYVDGVLIQEDITELNFQSDFDIVELDGRLSVSLSTIAAATIQTNTSEFDGYVLTGADSNVQLALNTISAELRSIDLQLNAFPASSVLTSTSEFDGYSLTAADSNVQLALNTISIKLSSLDTQLATLPASAVSTSTSEFDGYILTGSDTDVQLALNRVGSQLNRFTTVHSSAYAAVVNIDFTASRMMSIGTLTGDLELTTSNLVAGQGMTVRFTADGTARNLVFPAWKFYGTAAPTTITASATGVLALLCWGTTNADVDAVWVESV